MKTFVLLMLCGIASQVITSAICAAELTTLAPENWNEFVPQGKEVDCIYGDFVLRNDRIVAVVAKPVDGRNANMTVRNVGGCIIDLTRRDQQNDQLSAYYPGRSRFAFTDPKLVAVFADGLIVPSAPSSEKAQGKSVTLECKSVSEKGKPDAIVRYTLTDSQPHIWVETVYTNNTSESIEEDLADSIRVDKVFEYGNDPKTHLFWAYDEWFQQAYGVMVEGYDIKRDKLLELVKDGKSSVRLEIGEQVTILRRIFPGRNLLEVRGIANKIGWPSAKPESITVAVNISDPAGAVANAKVTVLQGEVEYGSGRTTAEGKMDFELPPAEYSVKVEAWGRPVVTQVLQPAMSPVANVKLEACGYVVAKITDKTGGPIPCKVQFLDPQQTSKVPRDKEKKYIAKAVKPYFSPDAADTVVHNLYYSHNGQFRQEIWPGKYDVIISYGTEYDAVFTSIDVVQGQDTKLEAKLIRTIDTPGWISTDFHSHSSPSGDNVSSQLGRVQNLLCEHIEFAPCTEHNRVDTYVPHLKRLGAEHLLATCTGIELTGVPLPVNHQNAFPLIHKPRTQNNGGPTQDLNPVVQIERLAMWDNKSEKLVQGNHPNLVQILGDKDLDGKPDGGFEKLLGFMDAIEIHPPDGIFKAPEADKKMTPIFHWMQMLNLGYRITGVVNTDAHYNFHGSGWLRNYVKSPTDNPAEIKTMDVVHEVEHGHVVITNGPFLEVTLTPPAAHGTAAATAIPGDSAALPQGKGTLHVRVQCSNWLDVNRVQVFLNGRPASNLNFTRRANPEKFTDRVVKFDAEIPLELKSDTHVIVATIGEGLTLGPLMGPDQGKDAPIAVSNPIFVDVDGNGFKPNGDLLDFSMPLEIKKHHHDHDHDHDHEPKKKTK